MAKNAGQSVIRCVDPERGYPIEIWYDMRTKKIVRLHIVKEQAKTPQTGLPTWEEAILQVGLDTS